jgi:hypothetical protein
LLCMRRAVHQTYTDLFRVKMDYPSHFEGQNSDRLSGNRQENRDVRCLDISALMLMGALASDHRMSLTGKPECNGTDRRIRLHPRSWIGWKVIADISWGHLRAT